ncbi:MAG: O-methyltransferase [archaeon GW2011_AR20]|nr:MAG: O-methyltransferase [archaeon GW2011_AR20]AQS28187.1 hypothetical protein [uncultured archaeon]MBS3160519.1 class I SAM-dependent methyltransferase [Candidatus Woesearchaeota archaeon]
MNKRYIYILAKILPKQIRSLIKRFYNPVIPGISKMDYGEISMSKESLNLMLDKLYEVLKNNIKGDLIEFGVYKGGSIIQFAKVLKELNSNKLIYGLDTFEGLPPETKGKDDVPFFYKGSMDYNNINKLKKVLVKNNVGNKIVLIKGLFKDTIPKLPKELNFCYAYVDCDMYEGTKQALEYLIPRMNKNGIIFIDDISSKSFVGVKKAVYEYLNSKEVKEEYDVAYWVKI